MSALRDPLADARTGKLAPAYALCGSERFLVERAAAAVRDAAVPPAARALCVDVLDGAQATPAQVAQAARTLPMLLGGGGRRCVLVRDADGLAAAAHDPAPLLAYLDAPSPTSVLVLVADKADQRTRLFAALRKRNLLVKLEPPPLRQLPQWILAEARAEGCAMTDAAAGRLAEVVGRDLGRLAQAVVQLGLYAGDRPVAPDDVEELIGDTRERSIFELTEAVGAGDVARTMAQVRRLLAQRESAIGAVAMLARHLRQLARARELGRTSPGEAAALLGVPPFAVEGLRAQSRRFDAAGLRRGLLWIAEADRALKGGPRGAIGDAALLEELCVRLAGLARRARA